MTINYMVEILRLDLLYFRGVLTRFQDNPGKPMLKAVQRVFQYLQETAGLGIHFNPKNSLVSGDGDADYAGCTDTRRSRMGGVVYFGDIPIDAFSKLQSTVTMSTMEAEYVAKCTLGLRIVAIRNIVKELSFEQPPSILQGDNQSAISLAGNNITNKRSKHIDVKYHKIRELVQKEKQIILQYVKSEDNHADVFTKPLNKKSFWRHIHGIGMIDLKNIENQSGKTDIINNMSTNN